MSNALYSTALQRLELAAFLPVIANTTCSLPISLQPCVLSLPLPVHAQRAASCTVPGIPAQQLLPQVTWSPAPPLSPLLDPPALTSQEWVVQVKRHRSHFQDTRHQRTGAVAQAQQLQRNIHSRACTPLHSCRSQPQHIPGCMRMIQCCCSTHQVHGMASDPS